MGRPQASLSFETCAALSAYPGPATSASCATCWSGGCSPRSRTTSPGDTWGSRAPPPGTSDLSLTLSQVEQRHIERVLQSEGGHVERAAKRLDVPRSTLYQRIKALGIRPRFRG